MKIERDDLEESRVCLDPYNSDLNLIIDASKTSASPLTSEGFAFMWAGARATYGVSKGKIVYEAKIVKHLDVGHLPEDEPSPHVVRVGFSAENTSMQLGEEPASYGYGGTGKISTNCQFRDYGTSFVEGDSILAFLNMDGDRIQIGFAKNGKFLSWAYVVNKSELHGKALYPHILTKNCSFEVNFGQRDQPYSSIPDGFMDYVFIGCLTPDLRERGTRAPDRLGDCEMLMMCGLPGAGKSVWAAEYSKKCPEKKYNVLGTNNIIDKMKVMGLPRKRNYKGRWEVLIQMASKCLNKMFEIGSRVRRNFILDQTNVYPNAQRRKMKNFESFIRKAIVVVPSEEEYRRQCDKRDREEGKEVPDHAVLEMKANFKLPDNSVFNEIIFVELQLPEAEKLVAKYNEEGRAAVGPPHKRFQSNDSRNQSRFSRFEPALNPAVDSKPIIKNEPGSNFENRPSSQNFSRGGSGFNRGGRSEDSRGGGRGSFRGSRGGYGSYQSGRGGFDDQRGSSDNGRGGYRGGRGGFDDQRGSSDNGRGGYRGGRGRYQGGRGGYESSRGGYEGGRGGYEAGRGRYEGGRGRYESGQGGYDSRRGAYDGGQGNNAGYGNNRDNFGGSQNQGDVYSYPGDNYGQNPADKFQGSQGFPRKRGCDEMQGGYSGEYGMGYDSSGSDMRSSAGSYPDKSSFASSYSGQGEKPGFSSSYSSHRGEGRNSGSNVAGGSYEAYNYTESQNQFGSSGTPSDYNRGSSYSGVGDSYNQQNAGYSYGGSYSDQRGNQSKPSYNRGSSSNRTGPSRWSSDKDKAFPASDSMPVQDPYSAYSAPANTATSGNLPAASYDSYSTQGYGANQSYVSADSGSQQWGAQQSAAVVGQTYAAPQDQATQPWSQSYQQPQPQSQYYGQYAAAPYGSAR